MRRMTVLVVLCAIAFISAVMLTACGGSREQVKGGADQLLEPRAAYDLIQKNKNNPDFVVLDVRTPGEFEDGHIEGAVNIDLSSGGFKTELQGLDKKKTYFVYCRTGRRSAEAVKMMREQGFNNIVQMQGDIVEWKSAKLPLVK